MANPDAAQTKTTGRKHRKVWRWAVLAVLVIACGGGVLWWYQQPAAPQFVTVPLAAGDVVRVAVATGTVNPLALVQVGSSVSGTIQSLYCDFNTKVTAGQLCAKIDPRPYKVVVEQARANLASANAQLKKDHASLTYAKLNFERDSRLQKRGIVSQDTVDNDKSAFDQASAQIAVDKATVQQRQAALDAALVNLDYTDIVSPVDGTVISRTIDVGQTVAASFQTPNLFLIAKDLTKMQVDTSVSESDIGGVKAGQAAIFTVEAYPDKTFHGQVVQVRQAPITVQNVVTYDVVIAVDNPDFQLLPGMTANMRIILEERKNVLRVPVQALRFSLEPAVRRGNSNGAGAAQSHPQRIYVLRDGKPVAIPVTVGLTDGTYTEISGDGVTAGDAIIVNQIQPGDTNASAPRRSPLRF